MGASFNSVKRLMQTESIFFVDRTGFLLNEHKNVHRIDWKRWVGYSTMQWGDFRKEKTVKPVMVVSSRFWSGAV